MMQEMWMPIDGYDGYEISSNGRVKSLQKKVKCKGGFRTTRERIMKCNAGSNGYPKVQLGKKNPTLNVHRVVAIAFLQKNKEKNFVNHINGVKTDNRVDNLEWCNRSENQLHAYRTGLQTPSKHKRASGEKQGASKLTWLDIAQIKRAYIKGSGVFMAKRYGVSQTTILNIVNNKTWKIND